MTKANRRYPSSTDVARLAGVSQSAVSRAFNEGTSISQKTRQKVAEAASILGYSPNLIPRMLLTHRSQLVALVIGGIDNPFYAIVLEEFTKRLQAVGRQVLLVHVDSAHALDGVLPTLASYRVDAIVSALPVLSIAAAKEFAKIKIPVVSFNTPVKNRWVASVCCDSAGSAAAVADLFVQRGARSLGFIAGSEGSHASNERLRGFRGRLRRHGLRRVALADGGFSYAGGFKAALALRTEAGYPDAVFCANDLMALGAMDALRRVAGLRIPEQIMIAGFDDIPAASWASYDLTTIVQDGPLMVEEAMSVLNGMMSAAGPSGGLRRTVAGRLIERSTTREALDSPGVAPGSDLPESPLGDA